MTPRSKSIGIAILNLSVCLWPATSQAGAQEAAAAETLYREAKALMARGEFEQACPKLAECQKLDPGVGSQLTLGECYEKLGKTASAWVTIQSAAEAAARAGDKRAKRAQAYADELAAKLTKLSIVVPSEARVKGLEVKRDAIPVGEASFGVGFAIDPGEHVIEATAPDRTPWSRKVLVAGEGVTEIVEVPVLELPPAPPPVLPAIVPIQPATAVPIRAPEPSQSGSTQRMLSLAAGGIGIVGLAAGAYFGFKAKSQERDSEANCWPTDRSRCNSQGTATIHDARTSATFANVGLIGGGVLLAGGALLFLTAPKSAPEHSTSAQQGLRVVPVATPNTTGLLLDGRF